MICILSTEFVSRVYGSYPHHKIEKNVGFLIDYLEKLPKSQPKLKWASIDTTPCRIDLKIGWHRMAPEEEVFYDLAGYCYAKNYWCSLGWR